MNAVLCGFIPRELQQVAGIAVVGWAAVFAFVMEEALAELVQFGLSFRKQSLLSGPPGFVLNELGGKEIWVLLMNKRRPDVEFPFIGAFPDFPGHAKETSHRRRLNVVIGIVGSGTV
jgi:hypothetical protein